MGRAKIPTSFGFFMIHNIAIGLIVGVFSLSAILKGEAQPEMFLAIALSLMTIYGSWGLSPTKPSSVTLTTISGMAWLGLVGWLLYQSWKASHFHYGCVCFLLEDRQEVRLFMFLLPLFAFYWVVCILTVTNRANVPIS
jgi:hypothetical protein